MKEGKKFHPMELCDVCDNQRVEIRKHTPDFSQKMIKESAKKPSELQTKLNDIRLKTAITDNSMLQSMALQVAAKPRVVQGRVIEAPGIRYAKANQPARPAANGDWRMPNGAAYAKGGRAKSWLAVNTVDRLPPQRVTQLQAFVQDFKKLGVSKGLQLGECTLKNCAPHSLELVFKQASADLDYILFIITGDRDGGGTSIKDRIKMLEHRYGNVTQCVTIFKAADIGDKRPGSGQILENIVNKANMKLGGVNYRLDSRLAKSRWLRGDGSVMLLGCDVNHPPPQPKSLRHLPPREPSVVGFVSNCPTEPHQFTGEISFQNPREEMVQSIEGLVREFAKRWTNPPTGKTHALPKEIVYFRDGFASPPLPSFLVRKEKVVRLEGE